MIPNNIHMDPKLFLFSPTSSLLITKFRSFLAFCLLVMYSFFAKRTAALFQDSITNFHSVLSANFGDKIIVST